MRTMFLILTALCFLVMLSGANCIAGVAENATTDISGWNLSACVNGFGTCWDLFWDNSDKIEGGTDALWNALNPLKPGEHVGLTKRPWSSASARLGSSSTSREWPRWMLTTAAPKTPWTRESCSIAIDPQCLILGTVMRNQKRKLYYDLIEAFARWLSQTKARHTDLANRTYLYLHTSYPDVGYDLGKAVREFKVGKKVLMTYLCPSCGAAYPSFFAGEWTNCRICGRPGAHPPNANHSVPREVLASIINLFDLYVQYSICEGWGMPVTEAMACGVPAMVVNYSAMEDHARMPGGIPINVQRFFYEPVIETEQRRALPDNEHFCQQLTRFLRMKPEQRAELARRTREYIIEPAETWGQAEKLPRFSYDRTAAIWSNLLRTCKIRDRLKTWDSPEPDIHVPDAILPKPEMNNTEFVRWAVKSVMGRPELANSYWAGEWIKALNCGFRIEGMQKVGADRNAFVNYLIAIVQERNDAERRRVASLRSVDPAQLVYEVF